MPKLGEKKGIMRKCKKCENVFYVSPCHFKIIYHCSISCSKKGHKGYWTGKKRLSMTGEKHPYWIKDRSKLKADERHQLGYQLAVWSKKIKIRDKWKCRIANEECAGRLEAHHILGWTSNPELRFNINNGITLCHFHHPRKRVEEKKLSPYFQSLVASHK